MKTKTYFTKANNFYYFDSEILKLSDDITIPKTLDYKVEKLPRYMNDTAILKELKPERLSLGEIAYCLGKLDKSGWYLFYPKEDTALVLHASWDAEDAWYFYAYSVSNPLEWDAGFQVVSRNLDPQTPPQEADLSAKKLRNETSRQALTRIADALEVIANK